MEEASGIRERCKMAGLAPTLAKVRLPSAPRNRPLFPAAFSVAAASAFACIGPPVFAQDTPAPQAQSAPSTPAAGEPVVPSPAPGPQVQGPPSSPDAPADAHKGSFFDRFIDEEDGGLDFSNFLAKGGFIPVPIIITEPAVDSGFGLAAAFLSVNPDRPREVTRHVAGAFKTGNGSKGIGYFQSGYAFDGRLNYRFGVGHGKVTLDAFPPFAPNGVEYTNKYHYGVLGSALWHLGDERFSVGPIFDFRKLSSSLDITGLPDDFSNDFNHTLHTGAIGLGMHFDNRDNPLTPTKGFNAYAEGKFNRGAFGSDRDYEVYDVELYAFDKFNSDLRFGFKAEIDAIRGDYPAFFAPAIDLRGVQAMRYQGENAFSSELEVTWQLTKRWSVLAFGGVGATDAGDRRVFKESGAIWAGGAGFRYLLARKLGFNAGIDVAYGPGGGVFYLQFGHAWSMGMD